MHALLAPTSDPRAIRKERGNCAARVSPGSARQANGFGWCPMDLPTPPALSTLSAVAFRSETTPSGSDLGAVGIEQRTQGYQHQQDQPTPALSTLS